MIGFTSRDKFRAYTLYWVCYVVLFALVQGLPENDFFRALITECFSVFPKILFVTMVVEYLMPHLLFRKKNKALFFSSYTILILAFAFLMRLVDNLIILKYFLTFWKPEPIFSAPVYIYSVIKLQFAATIPVAIKLFYYLSEEKNKVQRITEEKLEAELASLRNQFHPHFLFNSLNALYVKIINKSDDAGDILLKISDLLRFLIYDVNKKAITLQEEINYLQNYLDLQKLRFDSRLDISFVVYGNLKRYLIEPFLLLPFIENSFKFCRDEESAPAWVTIAITLKEDWLVAKIENSKPASGSANFVRKDHGTGIPNVKKRLELLYSGQYNLTIKEDDSAFFVLLKLKLNHVSENKLHYN
jgi:two-component system, LytTR family, sensor kinase